MIIDKTRLLLGKAVRIIKEEGFGALLRYAWRMLCSYSSYNILESTLNAPGVTGKPGDLTVKKITTIEEVEQLVGGFEDAGFDFPRDREIVGKGATLFCTFTGGELAHITQVFDGRETHKLYPFNFAMPCGETIGMAAFTAEKYRRQGIHLYTRIRALHHLKDSGATKAWDVQDKNNIAARDSLFKIGYYLWGNGYQLRFLSLIIIEWVKPVSKMLPGTIRCRLR